ncbi:hypothetical protein [Pseudoalteromonas sp. SW0106-04]|uniref:hypothetical protein n=1 Tax=Pseudoalteromonas sp. SW0106-04 TaxID=1702169 RepID=UPI000B2B093F|nr:hypothetical protein [Pseudoalteromonas sp. SW0106-04]
MEKQKWYKNPEMLIALTALFIGLITAFISIYSAYIDRAYAKASVWPKVEVVRSKGKDRFSYRVANRGTGPAIIKYVKVSIGKRYLQRWSDLPEFDSINQSHISSITLPAGEILKPLVYKGEAVENILKIDKRLEIELCYCSIYDDCWVVSRSLQTRPVEQCEVNSKQAFLQ